MSADELAVRVIEPRQIIAQAGEWKPGDIVFDAKGWIFTRASLEDVALGWPWAHGAECVRVECPPSGAVEEDYPARPLTLLVRDGLPVYVQPAI